MGNKTNIINFSDLKNYSPTMNVGEYVYTVFTFDPTIQDNNNYDIVKKELFANIAFLEDTVIVSLTKSGAIIHSKTSSVYKLYEKFESLLKYIDNVAVVKYIPTDEDRVNDIQCVIKLRLTTSSNIEGRNIDNRNSSTREKIESYNITIVSSTQINFNDAEYGIICKLDDFIDMMTTSTNIMIYNFKFLSEKG